MRAVIERGCGAGWNCRRAARAAALAALSVGVCAQWLPAQQSQPAQTAQSAPKTHTVKRGDTLWDIAKLYLGDSFLWPEIYRLNAEQIEDPHWIYPGEVLALPGEPAKVVAVAPPAAPPAREATVPSASAGAPAATRSAPSKVAPAEVSADTLTPMVERPPSAVRVSEYVAAPWVDARGGPRGSGYIIQGVDLPGIPEHEHSPIQLYDRVFIAPPVGAVAPEHELYLTYTLGPLIEDLGQVIIPTGVVEVTAAPRRGEAATARLVRMFGEVEDNQRLIAVDTSAAAVAATPGAIANGRSGKIRWLLHEPVLPTMQQYVVLDLSARDGLHTGDIVELYQPRQGPTDGRSLSLPDVSIARAQVLRVTPYGSSAIIITQEEPKIADGTAARIAAKMP
jgi:nucleoid-associated protein YgaU